MACSLYRYFISPLYRSTTKDKKTENFKELQDGIDEKENNMGDLMITTLILTFYSIASGNSYNIRFFRLLVTYNSVHMVQ